MAFLECLTTEESIEVVRQNCHAGTAGCYFSILVLQRPDTMCFSDVIRDQFNSRVALGCLSELRYGMMFGSNA